MLKKKTILHILLILLLALSLAGCGSSKDTAKKTTTKDEKAVSGQAKTEQADKATTAPGAPGAGGNASTAKNGAQPGKADGTRIMGKIVSVKDRTVTLALYEMPEGSRTQPSVPPSGGTPPSGNQAGGTQPGGQTPQLSGEKKTITIPTTVKIMSGGMDSFKEVSISNLKAGLMMEVRLNSTTNAVEEVRVMEEDQGGPPARGGAPGQAPSSN